MNERNRHLDAVKGFAILVVMLGHCIGRNNMDDPYINDAIKTIQMPLFMMVSGYLAGMGKKEVTDGTIFLKKLSKRAISYLLPFFSWVVVVSLLRAPEEIQNPFIQIWDVLFHIDHGLWFLMTLYVIQIVLMLAELFKNLLPKVLGMKNEHMKKIWGKVIFWVLIFVQYLAFVLWARSGNTFLGPSFTVQYLPFYMLGYVGSHMLIVWIKNYFDKQDVEIRQQKLKVWKGFLWTVWIVCLVVFLFMVIRFDLQSKQNAFELIRQMAASVIGSFVCFYGVYHLPIKQRFGLSFIGLYTLEIYTLHFRFVDMLGFKDKGLKVYSLEGAAAIVVTFLVMSLFSGMSIYLIKKVRVLDLLLFGKCSKPGSGFKIGSEQLRKE